MPEYLDIYNARRELTGKQIIRGRDAIGAGEYVLVIHALIFDRSGRFLTQKRVENKASFGGLWDVSVGGTAQHGDTSQTAAEREIAEELGLTVDLSGTSPVMSFRADKCFDDYWLVTLEEDTPALRLQPEEVADAKWVTREDWNALTASHQCIPYTFQNQLFDLYEKHFPGTRLFPFGEPACIRGAVFDMDGLLLDTERVSLESWRTAAPEFGIGAEEVESLLRECIGRNEEGDREVFRRRKGADFDYDGFRARTRALSHAVTDVQVPVKAGAAEILRSLKEAGLRLAVASSTREVTVRDQLRRAGLLDFFDAVITGDKVTKSKPDPEIFLLAAETIGLPPSECLAFEDSRNGLRSAYRAGMYPIQVPDLVPPGTESNALSWKTFASLEEARVFLEALLRDM